ncbi:MAG: LexA DNA binding domain protein [Enterococcus casseliflavus]|uniref:LexA family protein n=1 Tax=Enterococcus casseliflavus TaxID=37734 RepID=UPI000EAC8FB8|nr:LexA DNA binding domain protein [Enterococcus casseliflavus]AYJ45837.1 LexA DNA binding domain protein [Enterococcus casseliflavus]MBS5814716.1 LexA DNA binding domain protein [Enterococcus casseliflavus]MCD4963156.1 LexA DNA binding domain protein [Enterococcus casseliflavus]MDT2974589.1 LexA DNA binding domain protein [Enterococcus casseliflavus]MDU3374877.1 LexA DNA binding domain protein [Enterococcus casseliflavus]
MPRKDRILLFIDEYMQAQGCAPAIREICANEEIKTTSLVYRHLLRLEKRGLIYRAYRFKSRSVRFTDEGKAYVKALRQALLADEKQTHGNEA